MYLYGTRISPSRFPYPGKATSHAWTNPLFRHHDQPKPMNSWLKIIVRML